ncbi:acyl--CoA ligase family protein [Streptomyces parvulus]|uniref:Acyl-CoA synthetase n=1 Tax=Streptomyces parvulus TaxID=146923 RepID=A0A369UTZ8_9ACTN|nr:acyl--CoA ligase family protein [Streptomyces parvulus]RDD83981.1 acyl-CoA synthetase [Streptomyces parvulus]
MTQPPYITPLTPLAFLERAATVHPEKTAIRYGERSLSYAEFAEHTVRLAAALRASGVGAGDRVAYLSPNTPELLIAHFAVPLAGASLVAVNTRLSPEEVRYICDHSGAELLVVDTGLQETVLPIADRLASVREIVSLVDRTGTGLGAGAPPLLPGPDYEELLSRGDDDAAQGWTVDDELDTISVNYTSGTTGRPKGVMYSHRGAYLNALGEVIHSRHTPDSVYLWTLPMFHCNGWCTAWAVTAVGGTHVCLRTVEPESIWRLIESESVTHLNGAPTVLVMLANSPAARPLARPLTVTTAGAAPSPAIIGRMEELGASIVHVYGLTETYGPYTVCERKEAWTDAGPDELARLLSRQGVAMVQADPIRVVDADMRDVPKDGRTVGEVVMRGNTVMKGYLNDPEATAEAFTGGWFHSGDLGVWHDDGYIELTDRAKDVIVSGGENISTIEVEQALLSHDQVLEVAVVGIPDDRWGERPKAFVMLKHGAALDGDSLIEHVRSRIARYKAPAVVEFVTELPKTATGKIQKFELRAKEWSGQERRIRG